MENTQFDPNATGAAHSGLFGLPYDENESSLIVLPVPWEVTTSYRGGTANGPAAILRESVQVDLYDVETPNAYKAGFFLRSIPQDILKSNHELKILAQEIEKQLHEGEELSSQHRKWQQEINKSSFSLNEGVRIQAQDLLSRGKIVGVLGGDHSTPFGLLQAISEKYAGDYGILHIDAHMDLRPQYQGFEFSHASIMHNVMTRLAHPPRKLVQVGIRDFCEQEFQFMKENNGRIRTFFESIIQDRLFKGESWHDISSEIVRLLPENVYVSFDIDGLDPMLCPNTGTPVPGGLNFAQANYLIGSIRRAGKNIIGFDLNEVSTGISDDGQWDAIVGARMLYRLCSWSVF